MSRRRHYAARSGFSLVEMLAIVTILAIIAAIIVPRWVMSSDTAKAKANNHNKAMINAAVERWYVEKGSLAGGGSCGHRRRPQLLSGRLADQSVQQRGLPAQSVDSPRRIGSARSLLVRQLAGRLGETLPPVCAVTDGGQLARRCNRLLVSDASRFVAGSNHARVRTAITRVNRANFAACGAAAWSHVCAASQSRS